VPESDFVFVPLVLSLLTVSVPEYDLTCVGAKVTLTEWLLPLEIFPDQLPLKPVG